MSASPTHEQLIHVLTNKIDSIPMQISEVKEHLLNELRKSSKETFSEAKEQILTALIKSKDDIVHEVKERLSAEFSQNNTQMMRKAKEELIPAIKQSNKECVDEVKNQLIFISNQNSKDIVNDANEKMINSITKIEERFLKNTENQLSVSVSKKITDTIKGNLLNAPLEDALDGYKIELQKKIDDAVNKQKENLNSTNVHSSEIDRTALSPSRLIWAAKQRLARLEIEKFEKEDFSSQDKIHISLYNGLLLAYSFLNVVVCWKIHFLEK